MTNKEKLETLHDYILDAERFWRERRKDGWDSHDCFCALTALQDILQFAELVLDIPYNQIPVE